MPFAILSSRLPCQCPFLNESASISNKSTVQASFLCKSQLSSLLSPSGSTVDMTVGCFSLANPISTKCKSEEHTSELQSLMRISYAVFCLKKKKNNHKHNQLL